MRTTNFKTSSGDDLGSVLIDKDYLLSVYPQIPQGGLRLYGWGGNFNGQLGDNTNVARLTPRQEFSSSTNWKQVSAGYHTTAAIKTDGTLWTWGYNNFGQLGDNTTVSRSTPIQEFTSSTNWKQVSCGWYYTVAFKTDGTLWSWGTNTAGVLGVNDTVFRSTPVQEFTSSTNWKQVSCGWYHTVAIKTDGTLWAWGSAVYGQLGDNARASRSTPRQITSSTDWNQVSCGRINTAAIKTNGTLWCWGDNSSGQLGDNTTATRSTPRQEITSSTNWKQVSTGYNTSAIKTNGTLWCWGHNANGEIGDNTTTSRSTPRQEFTSSTNWKYVFAGSNFTSAIKTNGTLWAWGRNNPYGQLGDNTTTSRSTPRQITSSTDWVQISGGRYHTVAIQAPGYID